MVADGFSPIVLVVEDDEQFGRLVSQMLGIAGYTVLTAPGPLRAIDMLEAGDCVVDLLLSDVRMPGMSGPQLIERLRMSRPGLRAVLMTGDASVPNCRVEVLEKPFRMAELHKIVARALATPAQ